MPDDEGLREELVERARYKELAEIARQWADLKPLAFGDWLIARLREANDALAADGTEPHPAHQGPTAADTGALTSDRSKGAARTVSPVADHRSGRSVPVPHKRSCSCGHLVLHHDEQGCEHGCSCSMTRHR